MRQTERNFPVSRGESDHYGTKVVRRESTSASMSDGDGLGILVAAGSAALIAFMSRSRTEVTRNFCQEIRQKREAGMVVSLAIGAFVLPVAMMCGLLFKVSCLIASTGTIVAHCCGVDEPIPI
jgi:hypothetical protein